MIEFSPGLWFGVWKVLFILLGLVFAFGLLPVVFVMLVLRMSGVRR